MMGVSSQVMEVVGEETDISLIGLPLGADEMEESPLFGAADKSNVTVEETRVRPSCCKAGLIALLFLIAINHFCRNSVSPPSQERMGGGSDVAGDGSQSYESFESVMENVRERVVDIAANYTAKFPLEQALLTPYIELEHPVPPVECSAEIAAQTNQAMGAMVDGKMIQFEQGTDGVKCDSALFTKPLSGEKNIVFDVFVFATEFDALEIRLHTLNASVDKFVILEFSRNHKDVEKPFFFGRNKDKPRFAKFAPKIIHIPIERAPHYAEFVLSRKNIFEVERTQLRAGLDAFTAYVRKHYARDVALNPRRLICNRGHVDAIPHPSNMKMLQQCELRSNTLPVKYGMWFVMHNLRYSFRSDFPMPNFPYTFLQSEFDYVIQAHRASDPDSERRHTFFVGGWHMTHGLFAPPAMLKALTGASYFLNGDQVLVTHSESTDARENIRTLLFNPDYRSRMANITNLPQSQVPCPAFYEMPAYVACNRERFESWFGQYDRRHKMKIPVRQNALRTYMRGRGKGRKDVPNKK